MPTLYGARGSGSSVVEMACAHLGVAVTLYDLDVRNGEHRGEAYRAINPAAKMPTLVFEDGEVVTESAAILMTLDERHPQGGLLPPTGSPARAQALRWMSFIVTELYGLVDLIDRPDLVAPPEATAHVKAQAEALWCERWQQVEAAIAGSPYLLPEGFCATDLYISNFTRWDMDPAWRAEHLPKIESLALAVSKRPALADAWARHCPS
ncbi:MAG: glutathione S-transferase family protein [Myxococcota bacterium]